MSKGGNQRSIWKLRGGADKRFRAGHPWVYSNELAASPKGHEPGAAVELQDAGGKFLARGYGNPASLIAFRALSRDPSVADPLSQDSLLQTLLDAGRVRRQAGLSTRSYRLCFGESDQIPGLVIDRYRTAKGQAFVVQAHSAGADRVVELLPEILKAYSAEMTDVPWEKTAIVLRNEMAVRKLEGLVVGEKADLLKKSDEDLSRATIRVRTADFSSKVPDLEFDVDLLEGQKTGFFLDQASNVQTAVNMFQKLKPLGSTIRILDLFCYVGQWSTQLSHALIQRGYKVEVKVVDASASALERAKKNVERQGARCEIWKTDILETLGELPDQSFDLVVADPPALIKGRKDIPVGKHAYLQLNTQVFRLVAPQGAVVSCSCSALLEEEEFASALTKAATRNLRSPRWLARGTQAPDHPMLTGFPEGRYLKAWMGVC
jgi:23S rRNA (cytosine1962-C5)-methyltransferase